MALVDIKVPDIGDFDEVGVIELLVKVGDTVKAEQSLITVESDKASMEIPSSHAGTITALNVAIGDKVKQGSVIMVIDAADAEHSGSNQSQVQAESSSTATDLVASAATSPAAPATATAPAAAPMPAAAPAAPPAGPLEIRVPDIGDFKNVAIIEMLVKVGDTVALEQSLFTVESDKASMEIPSPAAGVIKELKVKIGDTVNIGDLVALMDGVAQPSAAAAPAAPTSPAPASSVAPVPAAQFTPTPTPEPSPAAPPADQTAGTPEPHLPGANVLGLAHASPSVRKFARELGVPIDEVKGTGLKGRITQDDVQAFTRQVMSGTAQTKAQAAKAPAATAGAAGTGIGLDLLPWPKVDFAKFGPIERKDRSRIKKISAANLHRNWVVIPHVTNHDDADITELEAFRVQFNKENEKSGVKVTMLAFMIKAAVAALKKFPDFNASLDGEQLVLKSYFHIGFAADTPNGLVVPVIRDADQKGIVQISQEMGELAKKARDGKLGPADMTGGCFSISSLGGIGGRYFTPIINAPEVAIMGVCKSSIEPQWDGKQFAPRLMLPLSLSWDHRVIDGATAARFNVYFASLLADFRRIVM